MKKILFSMIAVACAMTAMATQSDGSVSFSSASTSGDTTDVMTLEQIIAQESKSKYVNDYTEILRSMWGKNTFLNLIYNCSHKMSSKEFPSTTGSFEHEYESDWGVGVEWGHTFNFHRKPIGSVLFIGLDYTWMDLNINMFKRETPPSEYIEVAEGVGGVHNMPWHNKKLMLGYGMSLGPSLTVYPFSTTHNTNASKIRLQLYFHVGYGIEGAIINKAIKKTDADGLKNGCAFGHGLYTSYGANLTWDFIGIGFEFRNDNKLKYKVTDDSYDTGSLNMKEKTSRLYLQFRF